MQPELARHIALGREIRSAAEGLVASRGALAEAAAWLAARAPDLDEADRRFREAVAIRVSRMFVLVGRDRWH